eukprot:g21353.t4
MNLHLSSPKAAERRGLRLQAMLATQTEAALYFKLNLGAHRQGVVSREEALKNFKDMHYGEIADLWDPNDPNEDADSDELSDQIPEARRHSLTESETSKTSQERPMEVQSTKSLKQVTFSQAGVSDMLDRAHLDLELNRCAALASEASAAIPPCDQSSRCLRAFVATEVDVDMKKGDLEDAVKRCTKIAELLNQKLREQALFSEDRHAATAELQNGLAEEGVQLAGHSQARSSLGLKMEGRRWEASAGPMDHQEARPHRDSGVEDDDVVQVRRRPNSFPPPRGRNW